MIELYTLWHVNTVTGEAVEYADPTPTTRVCAETAAKEARISCALVPGRAVTRDRWTTEARRASVQQRVPADR